MDIYLILNYVSFHPRTIFKPQLTIRKLINSPVLSPTLLQIYCIGLILQFFWVWATICDPTNICVWLFFSKCIISGHINVLHWEQISHKQNKEHALLLFFVFFWLNLNSLSLKLFLVNQSINFQNLQFTPSTIIVNMPFPLLTVIFLY